MIEIDTVRRKGWKRRLFGDFYLQVCYNGKIYDPEKFLKMIESNGFSKSMVGYVVPQNVPGAVKAVRDLEARINGVFEAKV